MSAVAIEINDAALAVANEHELLAVEPGFARVDGGRIVTGEPARARARLQPRRTSSRFWSALSVDPGSAGADVGKSAAELAYAQLESLWKRVGAGVTGVVLVVPGGYRTEQLGLLLGLTQECGIPVRALVDAAAAASVRPYPHRQLVYVDASLHRVSVSLLEQGEREVQVRAEHALAQGLSAIADSFARRIGEQFVRATRFDPLAHAEAEQALYDGLPALLEALQRDERVEVPLRHRNEEFRITAERDAVFGAVQGIYRAIVQLVAQHREPGKRLVVQLSERVAALPRFIGELSRLDDSEIEPLPAGHAPRSVLRAAAIVAAQGDVKLLKRVPWREAARDDGGASQRRAPELALTRPKPPTHVVYGGLAYRVGADGLAIGREADPRRRSVVLGNGNNAVSRLHCEVVLQDGELKLRDLSSYGTFVNEKRVAGETALKRADVIRIGSPGAELHVVDVEGAE
jgi:hypothetical protein